MTSKGPVEPTQDGFTKLSVEVLRRLYGAKVNGTECIAYAMLTRYHNDAEHPARCWHSAQLAEDELGMRLDVFSRALNGLTKKTFAHDGKSIPILAKVSDGHNGRAAVYNDNLYAACILKDAAQIMTSSAPIKNVENSK